MSGSPSLFQALRSGRLPRLAGSCQVCRSWCRGRLCADCVDTFAAAVPRCRQCGLRAAAGVERCGDCLRDPPPFERTTCAVDYAFPWDRVISEYKFGGHEELAAALAGLLVRHAGDHGTALPQLFVPVPLSNQRLASRGYNQAWELARRVAAACRRPSLADALVRRFDAVAQSALPRAERLSHLRGAFAVPAARAARVAGRHLALVDDVMTTGATAREAAGVLRAAGAARVDLWVLARTPD